MLYKKDKRQFSYTSYSQANNIENENTKSDQSVFNNQIIPKSIKPNVVEDFWHDIESYIHEPGFFQFGGPNSQFTVKDPKLMQKLVSGTISKKSCGDLLPSVYAKKCCELYENLDKEGRIMFLKVLAHDFGVPRDESVRSARHFINTAGDNSTGTAVLRAEQLLRHAMNPLHNIFFDQVNLLPSGTKFLVDLRAELLDFLREESDSYLSTLNESLKAKLSAWMVGFLELERITWSSPAIVLEKLIEYEAVHEIRCWKDLKRRVGPGRRLFGFFFRNMPHEPLVFVQVALTNELSGNIQAILDDPFPLARVSTPNSIKCAVFYSITSQPGLSGIELGNFLIKRVVIELQAEFPSIQTFSTLSPIPGFHRWLDTVLNLEGTKVFVENEEDRIKSLANVLTGISASEDASIILKNIAKKTEWIKNENSIEVLRPILLRLCARYILTEKRRTWALDPVANFHIRNGACVHKLNWLGDISEKGLDQSLGIMVNYNYVLEHIEENNERYLRDGTIALSSEDPFLLEEVAKSPSIFKKI